MSIEEDNWNQKPMALALGMSQSEVSESAARSKYAGLLSTNGKEVMRLSLLEFLQYGLRYVFPQKPGPVVEECPHLIQHLHLIKSYKVKSIMYVLMEKVQ